MVSAKVEWVLDVKQYRKISKNSFARQDEEGVLILCLLLLNVTVDRYYSIPDKVDLVELLARLDNGLAVR